MEYHNPVMKTETTEHLRVKNGGKYIDCTLGDGGHSLEILKLGGYVLGTEINGNSFERAVKRITDEGYSGKFKGLQGNFSQIDKLAEEAGFEQVDGILYDLGYSSYQLEEGALGLSFLRDEPLDMRLDHTLGVTAADLINVLSEKDLAKLISENSDERMAGKFARAIVKARSLRKFQTTKQLAALLVSEAFPGYEHGRIHPATRTFQALRIVVNDELGNLERSLPLAARLLLPGGRMIVISFHSLEDRIVKRFGKDAQHRMRTVYEKPLSPLEEEVNRNIRARSAKMRVFEKI